MVGRWIKQARSIATNAAEADHYEWNARTQITVWGNRQAAEQGGLREYAHKEWSGVLRDFYYPRWRMYFDALDATFDGKPMPQFDFYAIDEAWTRRITRIRARRRATLWSSLARLWQRWTKQSEKR